MSDHMNRRTMFRALGACVLMAGLIGAAPATGLGGCVDEQAGGKQAGGKAPALKVVATTGMIANIAHEIAGERATVTALMGEGVDPHLYKASPRDVRAMSDADLILYNGLHLEGRMGDLIVRMASGRGGKRTVVQVTDTIDEKLLREPPEFEGHADPHVWFDVSLWRTSAERVRDALIEKDSGGREAYAAAAAAYLKVLDALHENAGATIATIPKEHRLMVTAHDAFGYFGRAYGLEVLAIQGISTDSEASLKDINALVETLVTRKVPAVFIESSVARKTIDSLIEGCKSRGHSVVIGGELYSDAMGAAGTPGGTYVGMVLHNVETVTRALGGRVSSERGELLGAYLSQRGSGRTGPRESGAGK